MQTPVQSLAAAFVALALFVAPAHAWKDMDVKLDLSGLNDPGQPAGYGVDLLRKGSKCAHPEDTDQKMYRSGDKIHVSFVESGDGCDASSARYLDVQLTLQPELDGVVACNLRLGYDPKSGQNYIQGTASSAYTCESTTVNGATTLRVSFND